MTITVWHLNDEALIAAVQSQQEETQSLLEIKMGLCKQGVPEQHVLKLLEKGFYIKVAEVETDDLEQAWKLTNHIESSWLENPCIHPLCLTARSSSVGDLFEYEGNFFICASLGFKPCVQKAVTKEHKSSSAATMKR